MPIFTRRWDDPPGRDDGLRILVTRYRPRGLAKTAETWDIWMPHLGPSKELHAAVYGKTGLGLSWEVYLSRYRKQMLSQTDEIRKLADRVRSGETISLLCSSQCVRESRCHRTVLKQLIEQQMVTNP
jgi:uncharacterized protein YeaO (DUF488 family)